MGGCGFSCSMSAKTAKEAYSALVQQALYENGHDSYNGTISTTEGFMMVSLSAGETVQQLEECVLDGRHGRAGEKWGKCACLDVGPDPNDAKKHIFRFFGWAAT